MIDPLALKSRPAVIVGNPASLFCRQLAQRFRRQGVETVIVGAHWDGPERLEDGTQIVGAAQRENAWQRILGKIGRGALRRVDFFERLLFSARYIGAMQGFAEEGYIPSCASVIKDALSISRVVNRLRPAFVFGQEVFSYGWATARCRGAPRILFPWGGDIFIFGESSPRAFRLVKKSLQAAELVCPASLVAAEHLVHRYGVSADRVKAISWGVDRRMFFPPTPEQKQTIRGELGLSPRGKVILNVRRFNPAWGCRAALEAGITLARQDREVHVVFLPGTDSVDRIRSARRQVEQLNLQSQFTFLEQETPLETCAKYMAASDVFLSLMRVPDMRSASILQAAACGSCPVLSEQREYRAIMRQGFTASIVDPNDAAAVIRSVHDYFRNPELRAETVQKNLEYIHQHEDQDRQMDELWRSICGIVESYSYPE